MNERERRQRHERSRDAGDEVAQMRCRDCGVETERPVKYHLGAGTVVEQGCWTCGGVLEEIEPTP